MNVNMQIGLGGFLNIEFEHTGKWQPIHVLIRFGVSNISIYFNTELRQVVSKFKPQEEYTIKELIDLFNTAKSLASLGGNEEKPN